MMFIAVSPMPIGLIPVHSGVRQSATKQTTSRQQGERHSENCNGIVRIYRCMNYRDRDQV